MKGKTYIVSTISIVLVMLIAVGTFTVVIDPLFQYHKPWFGMKPVIESQRYHNAGVAKTFNFDNAIIGNSLSENFVPNDADEVFGGSTVKLAAAGSLPLDWTYLLNFLHNRTEPVKNVIINIDPWVFSASTKEFHQELPVYLYDYNYFNDVNYFFNFSILKEYTIGTIKANKDHNIPDYKSDRGWDDGTVCGKDKVLAAYEVSNDHTTVWFDADSYIQNINKNIELLLPYIKQMSETNFVFFFSPVSMLYWKDQQKEIQKAGFLYACQELLSYSNVKVFLWSDDEMLDIMSDLNNYRDAEHYGAHVSHMILERIGRDYGLLDDTNCEIVVNNLFNYIDNFNYDTLLN